MSYNNSETPSAPTPTSSSKDDYEATESLGSPTVTPTTTANSTESTDDSSGPAPLPPSNTGESDATEPIASTTSTIATTPTESTGPTDDSSGPATEDSVQTGSVLGNKYTREELQAAVKMVQIHLDVLLNDTDKSSSLTTEINHYQILLASYKTELDSRKTGTVWEIISTRTELSTLASLLKKAGLDSVLDTQTEYTVFAPTNDAIASAFGDSLNSGKITADLLSDILSNHAFTGLIGSADLNHHQKVVSLSDEPHELSITDGAKIAGKNVVVTDITTTYGVVHIIDGVLMTQGQIGSVNSLNKDTSGTGKCYNVSITSQDGSVISELPKGKYRATDIENVHQGDTHKMTITSSYLYFTKHGHDGAHFYVQLTSGEEPEDVKTIKYTSALDGTEKTANITIEGVSC